MKKILRKLLYQVCIFADVFLKDKNARILMYHSHRMSQVFFNVSENDLKWQLSYLKNNGYQFVTMAQLVSKIKNKDSLQNMIAISYDDGHKDFLDIFNSLYSPMKIPVTLFWPTRMPDNILVTSNKVVCELINKNDISILTQNPYFELGSHSCTHKELTHIGENDRKNEIQISKMDIESYQSTNDISFAYPRGKYSTDLKAEAERAGYFSAVTTQSGMVGYSSDLFALPRISIDSATNQLAFKAKLSTLYGFYAKVRVWLG